MSEQPVSVEERKRDDTPEARMPSAAGASFKGPMPAAADVALEDILPVHPRLFSENRWHEYFARLREEDRFISTKQKRLDGFGLSVVTLTSKKLTRTGRISVLRTA